jgi:hypothetical protein
MSDGTEGTPVAARRAGMQCSADSHAAARIVQPTRPALHPGVPCDTPAVLKY